MHKIVKGLEEAVAYAKIERLQDALKGALSQMHNDLEYGDDFEKQMRKTAINYCSNALKE